MTTQEARSARYTTQGAILSYFTALNALYPLSLSIIPVIFGRRQAEEVVSA